MNKDSKKETIKEILAGEAKDSPQVSEDNSKISHLDSKVNTEKNSSNSSISDDKSGSNSNESTISSGNSKNDRSTNNPCCYVIDVAVLNELSRACHLAMCNISYLSNIINNSGIKKDLVAIYSQYANILLQIDQHFEKYGEIPDNIPNSLKIMGQTGIRLNTRLDRSDSHIAEIMIQGENMGIIKCQKLLNANYDIENSTTDLLETFRDFQKENISKLSSYL